MARMLLEMGVSQVDETVVLSNYDNIRASGVLTALRSPKRSPPSPLGHRKLNLVRFDVRD